ncbi:ATP-dependent Clp protease ClpS [Schleiferia thermophila str. Yellowstone]|uniref:ATP-dependent Clp protease adaptor protein ClpS n=2 Tax=Schleiferia thermophila TaxID=884107 RepID=A0A369AAB4_9FLAO|nr:ATP-dependent Clp protease adaptor ClpS [Schleiferia thermophila]KFD38615.1 ATP-dependent Clp protease ClpS [Schleiferia thermophila str. Yellowstone]PMB19100.1 Clp protease ClpS [Fischerella thermalis CCMEE 5319]RCX05236.1 ATP-dependent Clp protease adaptor protein ClpS [Schleiferia thermophila]
MNTLFEFQTDTKVSVLEELTTVKSIILFNDDVNTFDWVIEALIEVCGHTPEQAEQCAWITHLKGKCDVKNGSYEELKPMCTELLNRGLSAEIH